MYRGLPIIICCSQIPFFYYARSYFINESSRFSLGFHPYVLSTFYIHKYIYILEYKNIAQKSVQFLKVVCNFCFLTLKMIMISLLRSLIFFLSSVIHTWYSINIKRVNVISYINLLFFFCSIIKSNRFCFGQFF